MWQVFLVFAVAVSMSSDSAFPADLHIRGKSAKSENSSAQHETNSPKEVNALLSTLKKALTEGDAETAASLWTEDAIFIDDSGEETIGRKALQKRFQSHFQERQQNSYAKGFIEFEPERVVSPSENIAMIVGAVTKRTGESSVTATRFSMVLVKRKDGWLIAQATETRINASSAFDHLCALDWLIGGWKTTTANGVATVKAEWAPGKNFIWITSVITDKDSLQTTDRQVIGWDERAGSIVSWFFGHRGNFAYGRWRQDGNNWLVDVAGTGSDGSDLRSTDVYSPKTTEQFVWQSIGRSNSGTSLPDTGHLTVEKISGGER